MFTFILSIIALLSAIATSLIFAWEHDLFMAILWATVAMTDVALIAKKMYRYGDTHDIDR